MFSLRSRSTSRYTHRLAPSIFFLKGFFRDLSLCAVEQVWYMCIETSQALLPMIVWSQLWSSVRQLGGANICTFNTFLRRRFVSLGICRQVSREQDNVHSKICPQKSSGFSQYEAYYTYSTCSTPVCSLLTSHSRCLKSYICYLCTDVFWLMKKLF